MKKTTCLSFLTFIIRRVRLTDACLLIFMGILLFQSAFNLFFNELAGADGSNVDVIVRTTSAAIFGYFIGAGFLREDPIEQNKNPEPPANTMRALAPRPLHESGTSVKVPLAVRSMQLNTENAQISHLTRLHRQQIIIVASIGVFSLLTLVVVNQCATDLPIAAVATVSQFRDFVSSSVGLLIGNSTRRMT